jgi:PST family polysaccharide transporter
MRLSLGNKDTLMGRASRALSLSFISVAVLRFSTLGVGILLARLLGPHAFGVYAVAFVALLAVLSFNELGVSLAIVRWPGDPSEIASTVATISCVSSVLLFIGFYLGAPAFASAMGAPAATPVIRVLSTSILIDSVVAVPAAMLQRNFRQDRKMIADQVHGWLFVGVAIGLAWAGFGAMSLALATVAGTLAGGILIMVFSHPPRFGFDRIWARRLLKFGLPLAASSFIVFLVGNVDNVIVGHMLGATALGFYALAWNLSSWPVTMFSLPVRSVAPALFSRLQHDRPAMHISFLSCVGLLASVTLPVCLLMSGSAVPLVDFAYGSKWASAAPVLVWLAGVGALRILFELSYDYFVVLARSRVVFTVQLAWLIALIPALIVAVRMDGVRGAAIAGFAVAGGVILPWYVIELSRVGIRARAMAGRVWMPLLGGAGVGFLALSLTGRLANSLTVLLISGVVALGTIGLLIYRLRPDLTTLRSAFGNADHAAEPEAEQLYERKAEQTGAALAHEQTVAHSAETLRERLNGRPAQAGNAADVYASPSSGLEDTVRFPALREWRRHGVVIDDTYSTAEMTAPLPIFHDAFVSRMSGPAPASGRPPHSRQGSHRADNMSGRVSDRRLLRVSDRRLLRVSDRRLLRSATSRSHAIFMVQAFAVAVMVFPSNLIIKAVGAQGYPAILIAYVMLLAWVAATLFGLHNPLNYRYPVRIALWALWLVALISYAFINPAIVGPLQQASADRWLMQLAGITGVILVTAECLRSIEDIRRVLRALTWGGAFCGIVAALQYRLSLDVTPYLRWVLPGFSLNQIASTNAEIVLRGSLNRAFGTATDPIELGVTAGMLLPLAVWMAMYDAKRSAFSRWFPVICIAIAATASVSRSAILAIIVSMGLLVTMMRPVQRVKALAAMPLAVAIVFVSAHGLIGTLKSFIQAGTGDPSVAHRVNNYPLVGRLVAQAPWFGQGGGTYIAKSALYILDNQYLTTAIELGLVGVAALLFYFIWPAIAALLARKRTDDPEIRDLCAALAGATLAAAVCSATFDSLSFPMFVSVQALVLGLIGAVWIVVDREREAGQGLAGLSFGPNAIRRIDRPIRAGIGVGRPAGGN